jgi:hypothetical protein
MNRTHAQKHSTGAIKALSLRGIGRELENLRPQQKIFFRPTHSELFGVHGHQAIKTAGESGLGALGIAHNAVHGGELLGVAL